jgi:hypothetical protein
MTHDDLANPNAGCHRVRSVLRFALRLNRLEGARGCEGMPTRSAVTRRWGAVFTRRLACVAFALGFGCVTDNAPESSASAAAPRASEPSLDLTGEAAWPPEYTSDPLWVRASSGDDIDQARLARRENAESLLVAVAQGGSLGRAALAALPYAGDRRGAQGALCALLARADAASLGPLLAALYEVVMNAPRMEDPTDPSAERRCVDALTNSTRREPGRPEDRDRAQVVIARLRAP